MSENAKAAPLLFAAGIALAAAVLAHNAAAAEPAKPYAAKPAPAAAAPAVPSAPPPAAVAVPAGQSAAKPASAAAAQPSPAAAAKPAPAAAAKRPARARAPRTIVVVAAPPAPPARVITPKFNDLMTAVYYLDPPAVQELLGLGKWPDKPDSRGVTPLMAAAELGQVGCAEALLVGGANPNLSSAGGETAASFARRRADNSMLALLQRYGGR